MKYPEQYRILIGPMGSAAGNDGGAFDIPFEGKRMLVIASPSSDEWEHVSVSLKNRVPRWHEMCHIKNLFWDGEETVVQFHPKESEYIDNHPNCLHLWRHKSGHDLPPSILVGI